jgi:hypothetical protein
MAICRYAAALLLLCAGCQEKEEEPFDYDHMAILEDVLEEEFDVNEAIDTRAIAEEDVLDPGSLILETDAR